MPDDVSPEAVSTPTFSSQPSTKKLIVIGGGAAGFFSAINAARMNRNLQVTILEKTGKLLSKVKVSGGGRCNVTHAVFEPGEMSKRYPRGQNFVKKTFHQFGATDTISWFGERGVVIKEEEDGRMFPITDSSQTIINCLIDEAKKYGVMIMLNTDVKKVEVHASGFAIHLADSNLLMTDYVCIACGGYPKLTGFEWLQQLGHTIAVPVPSLFTFNLPQHPVTKLMGVSVPKVKVKIEGSKLAEEGPVLITHWGLSGPVVLRLSAWGAIELAATDYHFKVHINWLPPFNEQTLKEEFQRLRRSQASAKVILHSHSLPNRLWSFLLGQSGIPEEIRFADLPSKTENNLIKNIVDYVVEVKGKTTFKEEFVTAGGINLSEVDANTMMSKKVPRLFFAGEILDVDGITGGFNFQHAWTSGWIAGKSIAETAKA
jgi:predicted Rossmann fold flavoprotein